MYECREEDFATLAKLIEEWMKKEEEAGREIISAKASVLALYLSSRVKLEKKN